MTSPLGYTDYGGGAGFRSLEGLVWDYVINTPANPAAGADFSLTVPTNSLWEIVHIGFHITTSATAANRFLACQVLDAGSNELFLFFASGSSLGASGGSDTRFEVGIPQLAGNIGITSFNSSAMPPKLMVTDGFKIGSHIYNIQAGDQISGIRIIVRAYKSLKKISFT
jgi:hypothetical protein